MYTDLYVSYSENDDHDNRVTNLISILRKQLKRETGHDFFASKDHQEISIDMQPPHIRSEKEDRSYIEKTINESHIILIVRSPSFYSDQKCAWELQSAFEKQKNHTQIITFAIDLKPFNNEVYYKNKHKYLSLEVFEYSQNVYSIDGKSIASVDYLSDEQQELSDFADAIMCTLNSLGKEDNIQDNIQIIDEKIDQFDNRQEEIENKIPKNRLYIGADPVCVIYTGGTVGMVREFPTKINSPLKIGTIREVLNYIPKVRNLPYDIHFYAYSKPLDSSNISSKDWEKLAQIIKLLYKSYRGFVIMHGANTMAYTASALSFMLNNLGKPVIITGAEIPLVELHSDAEQNLIRSIRAVGSGDALYINEVCILYGNSLIRGNRSTKKHTLSTTQGFYSPNYRNLGTVEHDKMQLEYRLLDRPKSNASILKITGEIADKKIFILDVYPDMDMKIFDYINQENDLDGLIIRTYGTGNGPDDESSGFLIKLEKLIDDGVIIVNLSQCREGRVELRLFETNAGLFDKGVINGGDMTTEAAYCKLKYLFSEGNSIEMIKQKMQENLRGELSYSAYSIKYEEQKGLSYIVDPVFYGKKKEGYEIDATCIEKAVVRIKDIELCEHIEDDSLSDVSVSIYLNSGQNYLSSDNLICTFEHHFESNLENKKTDSFSINLEVTEKVRDIVRAGISSADMQVKSNSKHKLKFDSLQLIIFTRDL